ncbi:MAG: beta-ketoacyl-ACP synthase II [Thermodesulfobacteriota bacterium]|nr:beta-ketoacyl-ACP synthase II [Thermodesulfobacteriota bacterium]
MKRRVVITGLGVIAPNGIGKEAFWDALVNGRSGIGKITRFDASTYPSQIAGEVSGFDPTDYMNPKKARRTDRFTHFGLAASKLAIEDARLQIDPSNAYNIGVSIGSASGGEVTLEEQCNRLMEKGIRRLSPFATVNMFHHAPASEVVEAYRLKGPTITVSTGCPAGLSAISTAFDKIRHGEVDIMISGGVETPLAPFLFASFCVPNTLSTKNDTPEKASRPFDMKRDGTVLGEGAGIVVLESLDSARRRNVEIYAEVTGKGITSDGYSTIHAEISGKQSARSIEIALEAARLRAEDIGYFNAHGSSYPEFDIKETNAIKLAFGEYAYKLPVSSIKSMIGQPLAAAGGLQFVSTVLTIKENIIPPTTNYEFPDPKCDLDYVPNEPRRKEVNHAVVNSYGYGGINVALVISKYRQ